VRAVTILVEQELWERVEAEAARLGVSTDVFMREAALAHMAGGGAAPKLPDPLSAARDPQRLAAVTASGLLDSPQEERFDRVTREASETLNAPTALISVVDGDRQVFKSAAGLSEPWASERQTPLSHSFCQYVVATGRPLVVSDAREDATLSTNGAVTEMGMVAYCGVPLTTRDGHTLGALCAIDPGPREWTVEDVGALVELAASAMAEIERGG
jgi:GAF domain-containing protein